MVVKASLTNNRTAGIRARHEDVRRWIDWLEAAVHRGLPECRQTAENERWAFLVRTIGEEAATALEARRDADRAYWGERLEEARDAGRMALPDSLDEPSDPATDARRFAMLRRLPIPAKDAVRDVADFQAYLDARDIVCARAFPAGPSVQADAVARQQKRLRAIIRAVPDIDNKTLSKMRRARGRR